MDIIEITRELGKAIQQDERYVKYQMAIQVCDEDKELQDMIGEFNLKKKALNRILNSPDEDKSDMKVLDEQVRDIYNKIMAHPSMVNFNEQKSAFDEVMKAISTIITKSAAGDDPDIIDPSACSGDCSSCGGCH